MPDMENKVVAENEAVQDNYMNHFVPGVHRWGRLSMVIAFCLSFLPIAYMLIVKGWKAPNEAFVAVIIAIVSYGIGMWLTEPLSYFPILGAAGTYMSYLAGNVGNMRNPVAMSVQALFDTDVNTPKGQVVTICAIAISVYVNLAVLLVIVLTGSWLLSILPAVILDALNYVMPSLFGCMLVMRTAKNRKDSIYYLIVAIVVFFVCRQIPAVATFGMALSVGITILGAYGIHRVRVSKDQ